MVNISCIRQQADIKQINRCKDRVSELNSSFDYLSNGLELAGNNVRLKILFMLYEEKRLCVCDLSDILEVLLLRSTDMDIELLISFLYNRSEILKSLGYPQLAKNDLEKLRLLGSDLGLEPV